MANTIHHFFPLEDYEHLTRLSESDLQVEKYEKDFLESLICSHFYEVEVISLSKRSFLALMPNINSEIKKISTLMPNIRPSIGSEIKKSQCSLPNVTTYDYPYSLSDEFKTKIVQEVTETGNSISEVAEKYWISQFILKEWINLFAAKKT